MISEVTFKRTVQAIENGTLEEMYLVVPEEFRDRIEKWEVSILREMVDIETQVEKMFKQAPKDTRKDFALWIHREVPDYLASYMFAKLDGKEIRPLIFKCHKFTETE